MINDLELVNVSSVVLVSSTRQRSLLRTVLLNSSVHN